MCQVKVFTDDTRKLIKPTTSEKCFGQRCALTVELLIILTYKLPNVLLVQSEEAPLPSSFDYFSSEDPMLP